MTNIIIEGKTAHVCFFRCLVPNCVQHIFSSGYFKKPKKGPTLVTIILGNCTNYLIYLILCSIVSR